MKQYFSLQATNGQFVCAEFGGGFHLMANRQTVDLWETFLFEDIGGVWTIRVNNGQYVCAEPSGVVMANRGSANDWERWHVVDLGNSRIALQSHHGLYFCAEGGGGGAIVANRAAIGGWETFVRGAGKLGVLEVS